MTMRSFLVTASAAGLLVASATAQQQRRIPFENAAFRTDTQNLLPPGKAVLELQTRHQVGGTLALELDRRERARFRDDGRGFDLRPRDGIFAGVVTADLSAERRTSDTLLRALDQGRAIPQFEGREFIGRIDSRRLRPRPRPNTMPIIATSALPPTVIPENSLFITDVGVLESPEHSYNFCTGTGNPDGVWTFGHVMTELAGSTNPSDFTLDWLSQFDSPQVVNGFTVQPRPWVQDDVLAAWPTDGNGDLIMSEAPFRPIAITLRIDLRSGMGYGSGNAGEARIVYCLVDENCNAQKLLLIFEYAINKTGCAVKEWGQQWADLSDLDLGSPAYNAALAELTTQFTDVTSSPNDNGLAQLRTNELLVLPSDAHWELREFILDSGALTQTTVAGTPDISLDGTANLAAALAAGDLDGILAGSAINPFNFFWDSLPGINNDERHALSLSTCNGCHMRETDTFFTHVTEASFGQSALLSGFLTGITVSDPVSGENRVFNDIEARRQDLQDLVDGSCFGELLHALREEVH